MNNSVALQRQVGGSHYKRFKIQPLQLGERLAMQPTLVMAFKYLCRFDDKDGIKIGDVKGGKQDLEKAWHCLECYFEFGHKRSNVVDKRYMSMSDIDIIFAFLEQFSEIPVQKKLIWEVIKHSMSNGGAIDKDAMRFIYEELIKIYD